MTEEPETEAPQQLAPPWHLVDLVWHLRHPPEQERAALRSLSLDVTVAHAGEAHAGEVPFYIAPIFSRMPFRRPDGTEAETTLNWYGGLQTDCGGYRYPEPSSNEEARRTLGAAAIFSRWDERRAECARVAPDTGLWESSGYEGDFVSVRNKVPFSVRQARAHIAATRSQ